MAYASGRDETPEQASDRQKARVVAHSSRLAVAGLVLLLLAVTAVLLLICDVLFSTGAAVALALSTGLVTLVLWFLPPLLRLRG